MRHILACLFCVGLAFTLAAEDTEDAIKKDRKRIEGTWRVTAIEASGKEVAKDDIQGMVVINSADGSWVLRLDDKEIAKGSSTIDPSKTPKTIDLEMKTEKEAVEHHLGIYELGDKTRKLCFAPKAKGRPSDFKSTSENGAILVTFERVETK